VAEPSPPFLKEEFPVLFDDSADFVEFMLFKSFISAQRQRLQPELTGTAALFNMDMGRLKFVCKVKVESEAILAQHCRHE